MHVSRIVYIYTSPSSVFLFPPISKLPFSKRNKIASCAFVSKINTFPPSNEFLRWVYGTASPGHTHSLTGSVFAQGDGV